MNLSVGSLSQAGVISLRVIANLALILEVRDTSDTRWVKFSKSTACIGNSRFENSKKYINNIKLMVDNKRVIGQKILLTAFDIIHFFSHNE